MKRFPCWSLASARCSKQPLIEYCIAPSRPGGADYRDPDAALEVRMRTHLRQLCVHPQQNGVAASAPNRPRPAPRARCPRHAGHRLSWLDAHMVRREWAAGPPSAGRAWAAPFLFYATGPTRSMHSSATCVRTASGLLARPSFRRAVDEARPYRTISRSALRIGTDPPWPKPDAACIVSAWLRGLGGRRQRRHRQRA